MIDKAFVTMQWLLGMAVHCFEKMKWHLTGRLSWWPWCTFLGASDVNQVTDRSQSATDHRAGRTEQHSTISQASPERRTTCRCEDKSPGLPTVREPQNSQFPNIIWTLIFNCCLIKYFMFVEVLHYAFIMSS